MSPDWFTDRPKPRIRPSPKVIGYSCATFFIFTVGWHAGQGVAEMPLPAEVVTVVKEVEVPAEPIVREVQQELPASCLGVLDKIKAFNLDTEGFTKSANELVAASRNLHKYAVQGDNGKMVETITLMEQKRESLFFDFAGENLETEIALEDQVTVCLAQVE